MSCAIMSRTDYQSTQPFEQDQEGAYRRANEVIIERASLMANDGHAAVRAAVIWERNGVLDEPMSTFMAAARKRNLGTIEISTL